MGIVTPFYTVPEATEALIITGGFGKRTAEDPFKIVVGRGAFWIPLVHRVKTFYIGSYNVPISLSAQTQQNIDIDVDANVVFRVRQSDLDIKLAASRFIDESREDIEAIAREIFAGEARAIIGTMSVNDIINNRMKFASEVVTATEPSLTRLGWQVDSFQISSITDKNNHIANLSKPELVRVEKEAEIVQAQAEAEIEERRQRAKREMSEYQKETDLKVSQNTIETAQKRAEADQSGPIESARQQSLLEKEQTSLAELQALRREKELLSEVVKPAEAQAQAQRIKADAEAESIKTISDATAQNEGMELKRILIQEVMPEAFQSLEKALQGADLSFYGTSQEGTQALAHVAKSMLDILNEESSRIIEK